MDTYWTLVGAQLLRSAQEPTFIPLSPLSVSPGQLSQQCPKVPMSQSSDVTPTYLISYQTGYLNLISHLREKTQGKPRLNLLYNDILSLSQMSKHYLPLIEGYK